MDRRLRHHSRGAQTTPTVHHHDIPPAVVLTAFLAVSPLIKGVKAGAAKRTRLEYLGIKLGEDIETRARCHNATKWDVSAVTNMGFMFSRDFFFSFFDIAPQRFGVPL